MYEQKHLPFETTNDCNHIRNVIAAAPWISGNIYLFLPVPT